MPKKSIFRQPGAQHFQLVHRSQRDPLIHDPDASQHVLKAFVRANNKKGKTRADLESLLSPDDVAHDAHAHVGEASLYGVYFDDTEYDYMQHLRTAGAEEEGVESILVEAPVTSQKSKGKGKSKDPISLRDLPPEALPSTTEIPRNYESQEAVPSSIAGFQPDMDPHLRQVLEALEDDAFVDDGLEDDFFGELVAEGQRDEDDEFGYQFYEDGDTPQDTPSTEDHEDHEDPDSWEARFAKFKKEQKEGPPPSDSDDELQSEGGDTVGTLPKLPVIGGKRRRKGTSDASGYSMSSSSMYRTETLMTLDERFDQLMEKEYGSGEGEEVEEENDDLSSELSDEAPDLVTSREDFEAMMDDFMDNYELLGRKLKPVLPGDSGTEKLNTLRQAMGQDERVRIRSADDDDGDELNDDRLFAAYHASEKEDTWDCETVLTTFSNLENHPRVIRARTLKPVPKITLDPKTGLPTLNDDHQAAETRKGHRGLRAVAEEEEDSPGSSVAKQTISRPRDESKEDKKARKQAVKADRQTRRVEKKATQEQFSAEMKHQAHGLANKAQNSRTRKL